MPCTVDVTVRCGQAGHCSGLTMQRSCACGRSQRTVADAFDLVGEEGEEEGGGHAMAEVITIV